MEVLNNKTAARRWVMHQRCEQRSLGLVPTMGALHAGHISLAKRAVQRCDVTVATIFVNPTQFAPGEDLDRYPRTLENDLRLLRDAGVDAVFVPAVDEMYAEDFSTYVQPPDVALCLEGERRPDHFRGVTTVVTKLFHILPCTHAFFGHKDYQQARVLQTMNRELDFGIEIEICPTVREPDGLALSSRNRYLSDDERRRALGLHRALTVACKAYQDGQRGTKVLEQLMRAELENAGIDSVEYAVVVNSQTLQPSVHADEEAIALIAARVGSTRLIDNQKLAT
ncbi:Pantoate-beta-alanine ligase [Roseimaritima ulvae]|uniref:Pantothenate synthetase n=2 Tax=Roseimaritima ulvae TaxID=980254 RepID=A0A5B9R3W8_9BACT|nr:Pantoate-beta-alanine ligase [Roseimaritima ulvae]